MLDYTYLKNLDLGEERHRFTRRDTMLYALGVGLGSDPGDPRQLRFVYEKNLQALPTMASVLGWPKYSFSDPRTGIDYLRLVHGEQHTRLYRPLPVEGEVLARHRIETIHDRGAGKGAVMVVLRELFDESGELVAEGRQLIFMRGDGGFSAASGLSDPKPVTLPQVPEREADIDVELDSLPQAALIYRLSGDYNPLHADPQIAQRAGFDRPILHGLCSYGMAAHAVLKSCCNYDAARIASVAMRFTAPVFPGERVRFSIWRDGDTRVQVRARVHARQAVVLDLGLIELRT